MVSNSHGEPYERRVNPKGGLGLRNLNQRRPAGGCDNAPVPALVRRLVAVAVLLLSVAIVAFLGLREVGFRIGIGLLESPTPVATPTAEPSASEGPLTVFAQIEAQVQSLRRLPAADIGPPELLTRAQLAETLPGLIDPPLDNATLRALGLLTADQDIVALSNELYSAQVLGYYDFDAKRMVVVTDAGLTPEARITYAHEYTHAMQDAAFHSGAAADLVAGQRDRELALLGLEEGDATTAMVLWAIGHLTGEEMQGITETPVPDMSGIPPWMVHLLEYPYLSGAAFVSQLYASGGWDAVDAVYADLPASTEQVLHSAKYLSHESPLVVKPLDLRSVVGSDWGRGSETTMGEVWISTWLEGIGLGADPAAAAAAGWGGDWLTMATGPDGAWALGWRIVWDTQAEATEFEAAYTAVESRLAFPAQVIRVSDGETIVLQASGDDILAEIATLAGS